MIDSWADSRRVGGVSIPPWCSGSTDVISARWPLPYLRNIGLIFVQQEVGFSIFFFIVLFCKKI